MFNVGVEIGQLLFVFAVLVLAAVGRKILTKWPAWAMPAAAYGVGSIAAFWTIERVASFWT
jgi:hypothetical protein